VFCLQIFLYTKMIMRCTKELDGIRIGGVNLSNFRYADDTAQTADSEKKLQQLFDAVVKESERKDFEIIKKK